MIVKTELIERPEFLIAGIAVRTINNGQAGKDIKALWDGFFGDGIYGKIENKASEDIYNLYTDYESDYTGYYTAILGCRVNSLEGLQDGLTGLTVPAGKYKVFSLGGKCPHNVIDEWQEIWNNETSRKYTVDFDVYKPNWQSFEDSEVKIHMGVL
jgi:predicted transcriptional regulator YdeE